MHQILLNLDLKSRILNEAPSIMRQIFAVLKSAPPPRTPESVRPTLNRVRESSVVFLHSIADSLEGQCKDMYVKGTCVSLRINLSSRFRAVPQEEFFGVVYYICFEPDFFQGRPQSDKEKLLQQACVSLVPYTEGIDRLAGPAAKQAVTLFGTKAIVKRCLQIVDYATNGPDAYGSFVCPLTLIASIYYAPTIHKAFFDHGVHLILAQRYWSMVKAEERGSQGTAILLLMHKLR